MNSDPTKYAGQVDSVMLFIIICSIILLLGVTAFMIYFVIRYNRKRNPVASQIEGNLPLEITWIVLPVVLVLFMFYYGYAIFKESRDVPKGAMTVQVYARTWSWSFKYSNGKKSDTLYVPINKPIKFELNSLDMNHSFYIPAFRIKEDIIAGRQNYTVITPTELGAYDIVCAEYCGFNHSQMYTKCIVVNQDEFEKWVSSGMN